MQEPQTRAHRPRHVRAFWRTWLAQVKGSFLSRGASGAVGILRRLARAHTAAGAWLRVVGKLGGIRL